MPEVILISIVKMVSKLVPRLELMRVVGGGGGWGGPEAEAVGMY